MKYKFKIKLANQVVTGKVKANSAALAKIKIMAAIENKLTVEPEIEIPDLLKHIFK